MEKDGKAFIFWVNLGMCPLKLIVLGKMSTVLRVSTHIYGVSKEKDGKTFIFWVNLGMWPLKSIISGKRSTVLRVSTHIFMAVSKEIDGKTFIFRVNLGMWPLKSIVLGKRSTVRRVLTHIYGVSNEMDGKTFIFRVNLGMWPLKSIVSEKWALFWGFQYIFMWVSKEIRWENIHFLSKPRHVTPQIDCVGKNEHCSEGFNTHLWGFSRRKMGKHSFIE